MTIIDRYVGRQILSSVIWAVSLLTLILVLGNVLRELVSQVLSHQLPISYILTFIGYLLPFSLTYSIPWGVLVSVLLVFGRLSSDNELVALRANGMGMTRICYSAFGIAFLFLGICLWINLYIAPIAQVNLKRAVFNLASNDPLALFGSDEVIDQFPNRKIYVGKKEGATLYDMHIFELNSQNLPIRVIYARRGTLEVDVKNEQILLHIFDARYEERDSIAPNDMKRMRHGITMREGVLPISLEELIRKARNNQRPNELTLTQLRSALAQSKETSDPEDDSAVRTEVSKRFSNAMAVFTFVLVGIPLAITAQRRETSIGIALSLVIAFSYFIIIVLTDNVKDKPALHPEYLIWLPNLLYLCLGGTLFVRLARR
jgi:lipopolysaccharide export LptBFGC system permease protein LptF